MELIAWEYLHKGDTVSAGRIFETLSTTKTNSSSSSSSTTINHRNDNSSSGDVAASTTQSSSCSNAKLSEYCNVLSDPLCIKSSAYRNQLVVEAVSNDLIPPIAFFQGATSEKEAQRHYQRLLLSLHPDKNKGSDATKAFHRLGELRESYLRVLSGEETPPESPLLAKNKNKNKNKSKDNNNSNTTRASSWFSGMNNSNNNNNNSTSNISSGGLGGLGSKQTSLPNINKSPASPQQPSSPASIVSSNGSSDANRRTAAAKKSNASGTVASSRTTQKKQTQRLDQLLSQLRQNATQTKLQCELPPQVVPPSPIEITPSSPNGVEETKRNENEEKQKAKNKEPEEVPEVKKPRIRVARSPPGTPTTPPQAKSSSSFAVRPVPQQDLPSSEEPKSNSKKIKNIVESDEDDSEESRRAVETAVLSEYSHSDAARKLAIDLKDQLESLKTCMRANRPRIQLSFTTPSAGAFEDANSSNSAEKMASTCTATTTQRQHHPLAPSSPPPRRAALATTTATTTTASTTTATTTQPELTNPRNTFFLSNNSSSQPPQQVSATSSSSKGAGSLASLNSTSNSGVEGGGTDNLSLLSSVASLVSDDGHTRVTVVEMHRTVS